MTEELLPHVSEQAWRLICKRHQIPFPDAATVAGGFWPWALAIRPRRRPGPGARTGAERQAAYEWRLRHGIAWEPPVRCAQCGKGCKGVHLINDAQACRACWLALTPEGRQDKLDRVRRSRQRKNQV